MTNMRYVFSTHSLLKKWYSSLPQRPTSKKRSRRRGRREAREENLRAGSSGITLVNILLVLLLQHPLLGHRLRAEEDPVEPGLQMICSTNLFDFQDISVRVMGQSKSENVMIEVKPLGYLALEVVVQWEQTYVSANPNKRRCRVVRSFIVSQPFCSYQYLLTGLIAM